MSGSFWIDGTTVVERTRSRRMHRSIAVNGGAVSQSFQV